jgi:hypothetical protein
VSVFRRWPEIPNRTPKLSQVLLAISEPLPPQLGAVRLHALDVHGQVLAGAIERTGRAHVDIAGRAAFQQAGRIALVDRQLGEQVGREEAEVDRAVGALRVGGARRGDRDRRAVQRDVGEVRAQAANGDVGALAGDVPGDGDAGNAVERLGDVGVGELADVFGEDGVGEAGRLALGDGRLRQAPAIAGDDDFLDHVAVGRLGRRRGLRMRLDRDKSGKHGRSEKRRAPQARTNGKRSHMISPPARLLPKAQPDFCFGVGGLADDVRPLAGLTSQSMKWNQPVARPEHHWPDHRLVRNAFILLVPIVSIRGNFVTLQGSSALDEFAPFGETALDTWAFWAILGSARTGLSYATCPTS